jgi:hypothetical protein
MASHAFKAIAACSLALLATIAVLLVGDASETSLQSEDGDKSVISAIVDLKAYCILARDKLDDHDAMKAKKNGVIEFTMSYGNRSGHDLVAEFASIVGTMEAQHTVSPGMYGYLTKHLNEAVLTGSGAITIEDRSDGRPGKEVKFDHTAFGLLATPNYFKKLAVPVAKWADMKTQLHEGGAGPAIQAWAKSGSADIYKRMFAKVVNQYRDHQQKYDENLESAASYAITASIDAHKESGHYVLGPQTMDLMPKMPVAGAMGADVYRKASGGFSMPSESEMKEEAMALTKDAVASIANESMSVQDVVKRVEAQAMGTTVKFKTSQRMFAGSSMAPSLRIVGTHATITQSVAKLDSVAQPGEWIEQTFVSPAGGLGVVKHMVLFSEEGNNNPWLVEEVKVQVGKGNPWVDFAPEGKDYLVEGFWLDPSDGKEGPFYRLARQKDWLLLPKTASAQMAYMKFDSIPVCVDMPEACFLADRDQKTAADMMQECDNHERCNGFTYTTNKTEGGGGCLKYRCESEDTDGVTRHTAAEAAGKVEYYGRLAFQWTIEQPSKCDEGCGFEGSLNKGKRHCTRITDNTIMDDEVCDFWTPKMPKPEIPEVQCPATAPCVDYVSTPPQECPSTCGYSGGDIEGTVVCTESVGGKEVDDQACTDWSIEKPKTPVLTCEPTSIRAPDCPAGSEQAGAVENADIPGCGMDSCGDRYSFPTIEACQKACDARKGCNAFSWAPMDGDKNHKDKRVCTMYTDTAPTSTWGPAQVFCKLTNKSPTDCGVWEHCAKEGKKCKFDGTKKVRFGHGNRWTEARFTNDVKCKNKVFGDPFPGQSKTCQTYEEFPSCGGTWENCAKEGKSCKITATSLIKYGHGSSWSYKTFSPPAKGKEKKNAGMCGCKHYDLGQGPGCGGSCCDRKGGTGGDGFYSHCAALAGQGSCNNVKNFWKQKFCKWTPAPASDGSKKVKCNNKNFGDPTPGQSKDCFVYVEKPAAPPEQSSCPDASGISEYSDVGTGKCMTEDGKDPEYSYFRGVGEAGCKAMCDSDSTCYGYSSNRYSNCLLWRSCDLKGGGAYWGAADCYIKKLPMSPVVDMVEQLQEDPSEQLHSLGLSAKSEDAVMQKIMALPKDVTTKPKPTADTEVAEEVMVEEMDTKDTDDEEFQEWMNA